MEPIAYLAIAVGLYYLLFSKREPIPTVTTYDFPSERPGSHTLGIDFEPIIDKWSQYYDVPKRWVVTVLRTEQNRMNGFNQFAFNEESSADKVKGRDVDSIGLFQILFPDTAHDFEPNATPDDLYDPDLNTRIACQLMRRIRKQGYNEMDKEGFPASFFSAYNAGTPRLRSDGKFVNQLYVDKARSYWTNYER